MRNKKVYSISVSAETMEAVKQMAKATNVSTSKYIETVLAKHINNIPAVQAVTN